MDTVVTWEGYKTAKPETERVEDLSGRVQPYLGVSKTIHLK